MSSSFPMFFKVRFAAPFLSFFKLFAPGIPYLTFLQFETELKCPNFVLYENVPELLPVAKFAPFLSLECDNQA